MKKWERIKLSEVLKEKTERNKNNKTDLVLSVTNSQGFVKQSDFFEGTVHSEDISNYKIVRKNEFAYNPSRINVGSIDILKEYDIGALSPMYVIFSVDETRLLPDYFKYYFQTHRFNENVKNNTQGSVRNSLSFKALSEFEYLLPPLEEQKRIVKILDQVNRIIEKYQNLINQKEQFIKSQFVEMFGNPLNNEKRWTTDKIKNVAPVKSYKGDFQEKVWLLNLDMIESNSGKIIDYLYVNINDVGSSTCTFNEENVLYSKLRPYLNKVVEPKKNGYATTELIPLKPNNEKLNRCFFAHLLRSEHFVRYISEKVAGTKMPRVSTDFLKNFDVILPPIDLQNRFEKIVQLIDKQKFELEKQKQNYIDLRRGLMQQLLMGKVRIDV